MLYAASSTRPDTNFIVNVLGADAAERRRTAAGRSSRAPINVSKGWLKAAMRHIDAEILEDRTRRATARPRPSRCTPGKVYKFEISVMPTAFVFKKGDRIRIELANGDSPLTDGPFGHDYTPDMVGTDTIYHDADYPSQLILPVASKIAAMAK